MSVFETSLRVSGLKALPEDQARCLIQEIETKATLRAIENKQIQIKLLGKQIEAIKKEDPLSPELIKDQKLRHIQQKKLRKKLAIFINSISGS